MQKHVISVVRLALAALLVVSPATAQTFAQQAVDTNNPAPDLANEFGPQAYVDDGLNPANYVSATATHADGDGAPDIVGAFRFDCMAGQVLADDPVVYPNKPGFSHPHQFYGNLSTNAASTYAYNRTHGLTTCGNVMNRSGYWIPAMIRTDGKVIKPDFISIYYKRFPKSSAYCTPGNPLYAGNCVAIPNALRMIAGYDMISGTNPTGAAFWKCTYHTGTNNGTFNNIVDALASCKGLQGTYTDWQLISVLNFQACWDGVNLDSANHRSHTADFLVDYGNGNREACDKGHPYVIPSFTLQSIYQLDATADTSGAWSWRLSSDSMPGMPAKKPGTTLHADYFEGWDDFIKHLWTFNCIDRFLNCSGNDLGNGTYLTADPANPLTYVASPRIVNRPKMANEAVSITVAAPQ